MLAKFEINGIHTEVDASLRKYVTRKIGNLDKYLPRHHRESAHAIVELKEAKDKAKNKYCCAVTLRLPHETINVTESTLNMYAAVDIVEAKLKLRIKKYKERHTNGKLVRHLTAKFRRQEQVFTEPQPET